MILCPHTPDTPPYRGQRATIIQLSQLLLTNGVNAPLCLKRSTNDTAITPSTFRMRFGFYILKKIYIIRRERKREREGEREKGRKGDLTLDVVIFSTSKA